MNRWIRNLVLATSIGLVCTGCSKKDDAGALTQVGQAENVKLPDREILAYIPSDTPYLWMGFEPLPKAMIEKNQAFIEALSPDSAVQSLDPFVKLHLLAPELASAIKEMALAQQSGHLEETGMEPSLLMTAYGLGIAPVVRIRLKDAEKTKAFLKRIEAREAAPWPVKKLGEQAYYAFDLGRDRVQILAFVKDECVFSIVPKSMEQKLLAIAFLQEKPQNAFKDASVLRKLASDFGFRYSMGYIDTRLVAESLMGRAQGLNGEVGRAIFSDATDVSEACTSDVNRILSQIPRLVAGVGQKTTEKKFEFRMGAELDPETGKKLSGIVNQGQGMASRGELLTLNLGFDVQKALAFLLEATSSIEAAPFQCAKLSGMNDSAKALSQKLQQLPLQQVQDLSGVSVALNDTDLKTRLSAMGFAAHAHPEKLAALISALSMGAVNLTELKPDGKIVDISKQVSSIRADLPVAARMTQNALGFALGADQSALLPAFMESKGAPGVVFSMGLNPKLLVQSMQLTKDYRTLAEGELRANGYAIPETKEIDERDKLLQQLSKVIHMFQTELRLTPKGPMIDFSLEYL